MVESNTLKSFILSQGDGFRDPARDDILIHDYQIANSVTVNTILSNYLVNLKYAWSLYGEDVESTDSYFKIVQNLEQSKYGALGDDVSLILDMADGMGSFV